jgi:hypothetical protein
MDLLASPEIAPDGSVVPWRPVVLLFVLLEILVIGSALLVPSVLFFWLPVTRAWYWLLAYLVLCFTLMPLVILLVVGVLSRLLPRPTPGLSRMNPRGAREERRMDPRMQTWALLSTLQTLPSRTPARAYMNMFPWPGYFFWRLCGAEVPADIYVAPSAMVHDYYFLRIGSRTIVGEAAILTGHVAASTEKMLFGPIEIGEGVLIGAGAMIGPNTSIGDEAVVAANTCLPPGSKIAPGEVWSGNPPRCTGYRPGFPRESE